MNTAIYYHPEAYTTDGPKLMGRNAAGESFLRGFISYNKTQEFWIQVEKAEHVDSFARTLKSLNKSESPIVVDKATLGKLAKIGTVFYPGPGIGEHAFHRAVFGHGSWSLCGITHTISSARVMDAISEMITAPVQPWDALICTSNAAKESIARILQSQEEYLRDRLNIRQLTLPQLPVIPLGIHSEDFEYDSHQKIDARNAIGADEQTLVVLYFGRLSFHAKAHPLAMYQALERAALATKKKVILVECGRHSNGFIEKAFSDAAAVCCPTIKVIRLDGREVGNSQVAWASADIFCSFSDNIQETFGITPIEAMAAGLPVVVSDWDGYKDTVRHGIDGFRISTLIPQAGFAADIALNHALGVDNYDTYLGHTSTFVAVDVLEAANAFERLFNSAELRAKMGAAGQQRARQEYDWVEIIPKYEALWLQLDGIRKAQSPSLKKIKNSWPARMDPFETFSSYATKILTTDSILCLVEDNIQASISRLSALRQLKMVAYSAKVLPTDTEILVLFNSFQTGPKTAEDLISKFSIKRQPILFRALTWLLKLGILKTIN